jgi:hypothetical protein
MDKSEVRSQKLEVTGRLPVYSDFELLASNVELNPRHPFSTLR